MTMTTLVGQTLTMSQGHCLMDKIGHEVRMPPPALTTARGTLSGLPVPRTGLRLCPAGPEVQEMHERLQSDGTDGFT